MPAPIAEAPLPFFIRHAEYLEREKHSGLPPIGLSFDDVFIPPEFSSISSRKSTEISLSTSVAPGLEVNSPIMTANMDTVTEWQMAQEIALLGGVGVIHRYLSPDEQARQVKIVKEKTRAMEDRPLTVHPDATAKDIILLWRKHKRGYVLVQDTEGNFLGMATEKDVKSAINEDDAVSSFMTPKDKLITVPEGTILEQAVLVMKTNKIEKVPVVSPDGRIVGVFTIKDAEIYKSHPNASRDNKGRLIVGAAVGVKDVALELERAHKLVEAGVDFIVIDIAHGDSENMMRMLRALVSDENINLPIIAGNIATGDAAKRLIDNGAKGLKVGIGPGWACDTRVIAGVGRAQISAIASVAAIAVPQGITVIADGGMRAPGDLVKALVAGADIGMFGGMFAGTTETPGIIIRKEGKRYKRYQGMASNAARSRALGGDQDESQDAAPEGREKEVLLKGPAGEVYRWIEGGLRSGMSYINARTIDEMRIKGNLERVTGEGAREQYGDIKS